MPIVHGLHAVGMGLVVNRKWYKDRQATEEVIIGLPGLVASINFSMGGICASVAMVRKLKVVRRQ